MPVPRPRGQQLAPLLDDDGAQHRALAERQALPQRLVQRLLLREQSPQRGVQVLARHPAPSAGPHVVPRLVREALHVVGQVAAELDDGLAEPGFRREAVLRKRDSIDAAKRSAGIFCSRMTGPAL